MKTVIFLSRIYEQYTEVCAHYKDEGPAAVVFVGKETREDVGGKEGNKEGKKDD